MERKGTVRLPGGELIIEWRRADDHVLMTGPVEYEGEFILDDALVRSRDAVNAARTGTTARASARAASTPSIARAASRWSAWRSTT